MEEKIQFSVQMTAGEVYRFTLYHLYHKFSGIFGICLSLTAFIILIASFDSLTDQSRVVLTLVALWFTILAPVILFFRSKGQVKRNKAYQKPLNYQLDCAGITVSQDDVKQTIEWENLMKIIETKSQFLIYSSNIHAFVFPKKAIGEKCSILRGMLIGYTKGTRVRFKGIKKQRKED